MGKITNLERIAVLIDADNAQLSRLKLVLDEISTYGRIVVKKAYGDWNNPSLKNWEPELRQLAIKPEQQFAYTTGKNATDILLTIDAMDLLATGMYDAFALVSSDSDYTPLAIRLRETGVFVFGAGEDKTPAPFRNACDNFILTSYLDIDQDMKTGEDQVGQLDAQDYTSLDDIHNLLKMAYANYQEEDGWANVSAAGSYIKRARPDFSPHTYGYGKLTDLMSDFPNRYELQATPKGNVKLFTFRIKKGKGRR